MNGDAARRQRWVRWGLFAALCLGFGALATVVECWWIAARGTLHTYVGQYAEPASRWDIPWAVRSEWPEPAGLRRMPGTQWGYGIVGIDSAASGMPGDGEGERTLTVWRTQFGWPMAAMERVELSSTSGGNAEMTRAGEVFKRAFPGSGSVTIPQELAWVVTGGSVMLPAIPVLPGFVVSTVMFGGLLAGLLIAPGLIRRRHWVQEGRCGGCGYELKGMGRCPECGEVPGWAKKGAA